MAGIKDIAEKVGVSKATVSIYLKDKNTNRVGQATKEKIEKVVTELNYRPNTIARSLSRQKSQSIGIMIPYNGSLYQSTFINELLSGIQSVLFPKKYSMVFLPTTGEDSPTMVKNQLDQAQGHDGVILFGTRYCSMNDMENNATELDKSHIPFVLVNMPKLNKPVNQIIFRDPESANAVKYLLELGHRDILFVAGRKEDMESIANLKIYKDSLSKYNIDIQDKNILWADYERVNAKSALIQYLNTYGRDFTAIYSLTDTMALGVYEALKELQINIPEEISVIGRNDSFFSSIMDPPLTTVKRQIFEEGKKAAEVLLNSIESDRSNQHIRLDSTLVLRESVKPII